MNRKSFFFSVCILTLILCLACHSEKPESQGSIDINQAALRAGISLTNTPSAAIQTNDLQSGKRMIISGMLREVGTARFSKIVLTTLANYDIHLLIKKDQIPDYPRLQYQFIEVTGIVTVQKVQYGKIERNWYSMTVESARHIGK